jgi:hypothetical protein
VSPDAQMSAQRLALCSRCPQQIITMGARRCRLCGCFLNLKARIPSETCPAGVWPARPETGFLRRLFGSP